MMIKPGNCVLLLFLLGLFVVTGATAAEPGMPEITAQGFSADQPQAGIVGKYPRLRVRIEAPDRIMELRIRERSYEVDLATTRDKNNLQLFGLDQSPRSYPDVTLDLQNYINEKIGSTGEYEFHIRVTDRSDNKDEKKITVRIQEDIPAEELARAEEARRLRTGDFTLQRTGTGALQGGDLFGIDWISIDPAKVAIRITAAEDSNTRFGKLGKSDFDTIQTADQLVERLDGIERTEAVVLETAGNRSAGKVFTISHDDRNYLLKVITSSAHPSAIGTVVTLAGQYKYLEQVE